MSCWIIPSHFGSGYFPEPGGFSFPCSAWRCAMYARAPFYAQAIALALLVIGLQYVAQTGATPFIYNKF